MAAALRAEKFKLAAQTPLGVIKYQYKHLLVFRSMPTPGKLEITIKINQFPADARTVENGWREFDLDCDGRIVRVTVKPKVFRKLEDAQANFPMWVAAVTGKMGPPINGGGFHLDQPAIQVFEKKPKAEAVSA